MTPPPQIPLPAALEVLHDARTDQIMITTMGSAREWMQLGSDPLDFVYAPSAMGEAPAVGLGLALAQPDRQVIVCNGDGCMLMNLGSLVTVTAQAPQNYVLIVFDNGHYEVTGMQQTAASADARQRGDTIDFCATARGCGFTSVYEFDDLNAWRDSIATVLGETGPTFVLLKVAPVPGGAVPRSPAPPAERAVALREVLTTNE
jgi:sulfopyruvate decarboxylase subunit beta